MLKKWQKKSRHSPCLSNLIWQRLSVVEPSNLVQVYQHLASQLAVLPFEHQH